MPWAAAGPFRLVLPVARPAVPRVVLRVAVFVVRGALDAAVEVIARLRFDRFVDPVADGRFAADFDPAFAVVLPEGLDTAFAPRFALDDFAAGREGPVAGARPLADAAPRAVTLPADAAPADRAGALVFRLGALGARFADVFVVFFAIVELGQQVVGLPSNEGTGAVAGGGERRVRSA